MPRITLLPAALLALVLFAASCSSDGDSAADTSTNDDGAASEVDDSGVAPIDTPVNPEDVRQLTTALTGADIGGDELTCLVERSDGDSQLTDVFVGSAVPGYQFTPEAFTALAVSVHGCVSTDTLNASLLGLAGAADEDAEAAFASCVGDKLEAEQTGDLAYTGLVALAVGFDVPEGAQEATIDASSSCIGPVNLANQLAATAEQASGFESVVDRDCVAGNIDDAFLNSFWNDLIMTNGPTQGIEEAIEPCTSAYDSGLPKEIPEDFVPWSGAGVLAGIDPATRNGVYDAMPPNQLEEGVDYQAVVTTADGEIIIDLYEETAPITVNSFVSLARDGYYDGTRFHRVLDGFMAQAGDPTGTGTGGPGYSFDDEASGLTPVDQRGLLAMANSGPNTNGSQFFITFDAATHLDGLHVVFGEVIIGDEILELVDRRDPAAPTSRGEVIESIVILEA